MRKFVLMGAVALLASAAMPATSDAATSCDGYATLAK